MGVLTMKQQTASYNDGGVVAVLKDYVIATYSMAYYVVRKSDFAVVHTGADYKSLTGGLGSTIGGSSQQAMDMGLIGNPQNNEYFFLIYNANELKLYKTTLDTATWASGTVTLIANFGASGGGLYTTSSYQVGGCLGFDGKNIYVLFNRDGENGPYTLKEYNKTGTLVKTHFTALNLNSIHGGVRRFTGSMSVNDTYFMVPFGHDSTGTSYPDKYVVFDKTGAFANSMSQSGYHTTDFDAAAALQNDLDGRIWNNGPWGADRLSWFDTDIPSFSILNTNTTPNAPTGLTPGGSSTAPEIITTLTPTLSWTFNDPDTGDSQSAFQLLIYDSAGTLIHDTGKVASTTSSYAVPSAVLGWGVVYHWRVRTYDSSDAVSAYSADAYIETNQGPSATYTSPTGTSTDPTIYHDTVTPAFSWSYSDPEGNAQASVQILIYDGATLVWDSAEIATTGSSYTIPSTANLVYDKTYNTKIRAKDSKGTWGAYSALTYFHLNRSPNAPTNLSPAGTDLNPAIITDNLTPRLSWSFSDPDINDTQSAFQVVILDSANAVVHDSAEVVSVNQYYDIPAGVLLSGKEYHWRVRTKDNHAKYGVYAADQFFYTNASPDTPTNPSPAGGSATSPAITYDDLTPLFTWSFTDPNTGDAQASFQLRLFNDAGTLLYDSAEVVSTVESHELPNTHKVEYGKNYQWDVRVKDNNGAWSNYTPRGWFVVKVGAPTGVTATGDNTNAKIVIDWADSTAESLDGYNLFKSETAGGPYTKVNDRLITSSIYDDTKVITDKTYYYVVQAYVDGQEPSAYSAEVSAKVIFTSWYIGSFKFDGPTNIKKDRKRARSERLTLSKRVVQDKGFLGEKISLEIFLTDDQYSTGSKKYDDLILELDKLIPLSVRDPFGRQWTISPGDFEDEQLPTGKLEYKVKINLTEV
jgi:hypothetical protein